jgi:membrane protein implicated in regulation of membrane protease activity
MWVGLLTGLGDDGLSWFSILIVGLASFAGISVSALIAPKYKLIVVLLFALVTVLLVPRPYTLKTSGDGEAIPSRYELIGGVSGGLSAVATIFLRRKWNS